MNSIKTFEQKKKLNSWNGMEWNWFIEVKWTSFSIINVSTFLVLLFYFYFSLALLLFVFSILFFVVEKCLPLSIACSFEQVNWLSVFKVINFNMNNNQVFVVDLIWIWLNRIDRMINLITKSKSNLDSHNN